VVARQLPGSALLLVGGDEVLAPADARGPEVEVGF
jgi:hypothetical protein